MGDTTFCRAGNSDGNEAGFRTNATQSGRLVSIRSQPGRRGGRLAARNRGGFSIGLRRIAGTYRKPLEAKRASPPRSGANSATARPVSARFQQPSTRRKALISLRICELAAFRSNLRSGEFPRFPSPSRIRRKLPDRDLQSEPKFHQELAFRCWRKQLAEFPRLRHRLLPARAERPRQAGNSLPPAPG